MITAAETVIPKGLKWPTTLPLKPQGEKTATIVNVAAVNRQSTSPGS